jgi:hypothetical protein
MKLAILTLTLCLAAQPRVAGAGGPHDIVVEIPGERSTTNIAVLGGVTGAAVIAGIVGLYFHLDSRSITNDLSSSKATGKAWTPDDQKKEAQASDDRTRAAVGYSIGGALLVGAAVAFIVTAPDSEHRVITTHTALQPTQGGAYVSHWWSF